MKKPHHHTHIYTKYFAREWETKRSKNKINYVHLPKPIGGDEKYSNLLKLKRKSSFLIKEKLKEKKLKQEKMTDIEGGCGMNEKMSFPCC